MDRFYIVSNESGAFRTFTRKVNALRWAKMVPDARIYLHTKHGRTTKVN